MSVDVDVRPQGVQFACRSEIFDPKALILDPVDDNLPEIPRWKQ